MKRLFAGILMLTFLSLGLMSAQNDENESKSDKASLTKKEKGFKPLFNGKNFKNWELMLRNGEPGDIEKVYGIDEDRSLHFYRDLPEGSGTKTNKNAYHGIMATKKSYSRYHLKFEYKWGKKLVNNSYQFQYDAGMFYHIKELKVFPVGMQYQIRFNHEENRNHSGDFWASGVKMQWYSADGKTFRLPYTGGEKQTIKMGEHRASTGASFHGLDDEWNKCEIIVMGNEYAIHKLNGQMVNMATDLEMSEGPLALEAETGEILWRNIRIKEFKEAIPSETFLQK